MQIHDGRTDVSDERMSKGSKRRGGQSRQALSSPDDAEEEGKLGGGTGFDEADVAGGGFSEPEGGLVGG